MDSQSSGKILKTLPMLLPGFQMCVFVVVCSCCCFAVDKEIPLYLLYCNINLIFLWLYSQ